MGKYRGYGRWLSCPSNGYPATKRYTEEVCF